jgi:putative FmdB family regulatory protein
MPLYEYQCKKCHHRFERIQKFSDPIVKKCPECGGPVEQMISAPAVQFKGSGWYVNDYAKTSSASPSNGESSPTSESSAESKSDSKSESKSEAKSESKADPGSKKEDKPKTQGRKSDKK